MRRDAPPRSAPAQEKAAANSRFGLAAAEERGAADDEEPPAVGGLMYRLLHEFHPGNDTPAIRTQHFVVIARHVDDPCSGIDLVQNRFDHAVMCVRPIPAAVQAPPVDDVADQE